MPAVEERLEMEEREDQEMWNQHFLENTGDGVGSGPENQVVTQAIMD